MYNHCNLYMMFIYFLFVIVVVYARWPSAHAHNTKSRLVFGVGENSLKMKKSSIKSLKNTLLKM